LITGKKTKNNNKKKKESRSRLVAYDMRNLVTRVGDHTALDLGFGSLQETLFISKTFLTALKNQNSFIEI